MLVVFCIQSLLYWWAIFINLKRQAIFSDLLTVSAERQPSGASALAYRLNDMSMALNGLRNSISNGDADLARIFWGMLRDKHKLTFEEVKPVVYAGLIRSEASAGGADSTLVKMFAKLFKTEL